MVSNGKFKVPVQRIQSDDCLVYVGRVIGEGSIIEEGTPFPVHKGEWVEVLRLGAIRQYLALMHMIQGAAAASKDLSEAERIDATKDLEQSLDELCHEIAGRIVNWNWTDMQGSPLPIPYRNDKVIKDLTEDELIWLTQAVQGEGSGQRKNASSASGRTSSTTARSHRKE